MKGESDYKMYSTGNFHPQLISYPKHIALIPDGGRRWAKINGCSIKDSYSISMSLITQMIDFVFEQGTEYFSVFFASTFNFKRSIKEINDFCTVEWNYLNNDFLEYALRNNIKIKIVATKDKNMKPYSTDALNLETKTQKGIKTVYICFNYNSLDEIELASKRVCSHNDAFVNHLQVPCPVDILIRTGDANVLSSFLLPQIAFARIYFFRKLFNDFTIEDLKEVIDSYLSSELKYGE